jgi:SAM-dependent methyltransferase
MVTHFSQRQTQFSYFDQLLEGPVWNGSKILDFGGNVGGFLASAGDQVDHDDYWCLDVTQAAIEEGRRTFPRAHFVFYNRYSSYFNPNGIRKLSVPDLGLKFDIILAFSVFTHTHQQEMLELVEQLRSMLVAGGVFAFTFFDPGDDSGVSREIEGMEESSKPNWCVEVNEELYFEPGNELCQQERRGKPGESYCSYYSAAHMASLFPGASVLPAVGRETQHCCILRSEAQPSLPVLPSRGQVIADI